MSAHAYTNIVHAAVRVNELDWAENFLNEYKNKLPVHHRENAYIYSSAVVNLKKGLISKKSYKRKKYLDIALEYLAKVKNDDYFYMLRIKNMQIHIHCELKEYELANEHAHKAYSMGYPLKGLRNKLKRLGAWHDVSIDIAKSN